MVNLHRDGNQAKPYQARQVRAVILKHKLGELEWVRLFWNDAQ
jgi:hypothetical protein